jgi:hypothetical protein
MTVFDIDYSKFHLGSVTILKLIEWCIENNIKILDFSKGYFDYKTRWCTKVYDFEYHIYYDRKSLKSILLASSIKHIYDFKQSLREKNINEKWHKLTYKLKKREQKLKPRVVYDFVEINLLETDQSLTPIDYKLSEDNGLRLMIFEFLYLYQEHYNTIKLFRVKNENNSYILKGQQKLIQVTIN